MLVVALIIDDDVIAGLGPAIARAELIPFRIKVGFSRRTKSRAYSFVEQP
jgi:hypothetical protein